MIGNDVIDLALARKESNWERKGYLDKIFTIREQLLILNSENPENMVWNLWSRKEAAYKIYNRQTQIRGYFPLQLECFTMQDKNGFGYGKVTIKGKVYFTKTEISSQYISTIAVEKMEDFDQIKTLENRKYIFKNKGIPFYLDNENSFPKPVSISHHGRYMQIVCL